MLLTNFFPPKASKGLEAWWYWNAINLQPYPPKKFSFSNHLLKLSNSSHEVSQLDLQARTSCIDQIEHDIRTPRLPQQIIRTMMSHSRSRTESSSSEDEESSFMKVTEKANDVEKGGIVPAREEKTPASGFQFFLWTVVNTFATIGIVSAQSEISSIVDKVRSLQTKPYLQTLLFD